jgi:hypothetical protein
MAGCDWSFDVDMSSPIREGGPAFPCGYHPEGNSADHFGMSLRDYFAAKALVGLLSGTHGMEFEDYSTWAYRHADEMLRAREVKP